MHTSAALIGAWWSGCRDSSAERRLGCSLSRPVVKLLLDPDADEWDGWNWWLLGFKGLTSAEFGDLNQRPESAG